MFFILKCFKNLSDKYYLQNLQSPYLHIFIKKTQNSNELENKGGYKLGKKH